jgi:hypothetical protein
MIKTSHTWAVSSSSKIHPLFENDGRNSRMSISFWLLNWALMLVKE